MIPVAAGGLPPKGQDFNGIFNQISENIIYLSKGGRFKFSADYAAAINGYPKGAILQSDDEKKEYQSLVDNNKVNFNTATQAQINAAWKLISTDDMLLQIAGKQPAGDYATKAELNNGLAGKQPSGSYATTQQLNDGLDKKLDKTGGTVTGNLYANGVIKSNAGTVRAANLENDVIVDLYVSPDGKPNLRSLVKGSTTYSIHEVPTGSGTLMQVGDSGWGGALGISVSENDNTFLARLKNKNTPTQVLKNSLTTTANYGGATIAYFRGGDTFFGLSAGYRANGVITAIAGDAESHYVHILYSDRNTSTDRNGYLRTSSATTEMQGIPIGGSILWNTTAPIPDNFWPNEGRAFSAAEYPELAKVFPTLKLPDDRGYAIRMADNGRGVDVGRVVGTYQEDAIQNIVGEFRATIGGSAGGVFSYRENNYPRAVGAELTSGIWTFDASRVVRTADETRMKNVAKILITRVK